MLAFVLGCSKGSMFHRVKATHRKDVFNETFIYSRILKLLARETIR